MQHIVTLLAIFSSIVALGEDQTPAYSKPGTLGPNAFSFSRAYTDPRIPEMIEIDVSLENSDQDVFGETQTAKFRLEIPFGTWASLTVDGLAEKYSQNYVNETTGEQLSRSGSAGGDLNVTGKFALVGESVSHPSLTFKATVKSASGGSQDARFTNSAGYEFSLVTSKVMKDRLFLKKVRFFLEAGFAAWDDAQNSQNDAGKYSAFVEIPEGAKWSTMVGDYGLVGWRGNGDKPNYIYVSQAYDFNKKSRLYLAARIGTNDSTHNERAIEAGFRYKFRSPFGRKN